MKKMTNFNRLQLQIIFSMIFVLCLELGITGVRRGYGTGFIFVLPCILFLWGIIVQENKKVKR